VVDNSIVIYLLLVDEKYNAIGVWWENGNQFLVYSLTG